MPLQASKQNRPEVEKRARGHLEKVMLSDEAEAYSGQPSGGQQQRVAIARTLCMQREVLPFDEVTAALDPDMVCEVPSVIREIAEEGTTCASVTYEMEFARKASDRVCFTDGGSIGESAPRTEFSPIQGTSATDPPHRRCHDICEHVFARGASGGGCGKSSW